MRLRLQSGTPIGAMTMMTKTYYGYNVKYNLHASRPFSSSSSLALDHGGDARLAVGPCPAPWTRSMGALWQDASRHSLVVMCSSDDRTQFNAVFRFVGLLCCDETLAGIPAGGAPFLFSLSRIRLQMFTNISRLMFSFRSKVTRQKKNIHGTGLPLRAKIRVARSLRTNIHVTCQLMCGAELHTHTWKTTVSQRGPHTLSWGLDVP